MKKITLLIILFGSIAAFSQEYQIQLRLVDAEVGYPTGDPLDNYPAISNDNGLNAILNTYGADHYYPGYNPVPDWEFRTHFVTCVGCDINQLEQALDNYSSVIEHTVQNEPGLIANSLYVKLVDLNNGNNTGNTTPEGIVITNNAVLNAIFVDYTVLYFEQAFPNFQDPELRKIFQLGCDCSAADLKPILDAETTIIEYTERQGYAILGTEDLKDMDFKIYPNPVGDKVVIDSSEKITSYEIYNTLGQSIFKATSEENLNAFLPSLSSGMYLFNLVTESGKRQNLRFLKK